MFSLVEQPHATPRRAAPLAPFRCPALSVQSLTRDARNRFLSRRGESENGEQPFFTLLRLGVSLSPIFCHAHSLPLLFFSLSFSLSLILSLFLSLSFSLSLSLSFSLSLALSLFRSFYLSVK